MYAFRCSDAGEGEDLQEWSLPTLLTFELAWSPEMVRRGHEKSPHCKILSPPRQPGTCMAGWECAKVGSTKYQWELATWSR